MDAATAAGTAAAVAAGLPNGSAGFFNWALTDAGIIGSYQGALVLSLVYHK